jgi:DNA-binding transcriptional MerR regulator
VAEQLLIGDVTALTGIAAGRIRHYEKIGLLRAGHLRNGYRVFDVDQVLDLLRIDLLRSLGVGIKDIGELLDGEHTTLASLLAEHRSLLAAEQDRLARLVAAIDAAADSGLVAPTADGDASDRILRILATSHRDSIGVIGRLTTPLSPAVAAMYAELFGEWELPVPPLFGQMPLPAAATTLMEKLARIPGRAVLWERLRALAADVITLGDDGDAAARLARRWVDEQVDSPLPADVVGVLHSVQPLLEHDPVIVAGFRTWAASITPAAATFLDEVADLAARRGLSALSVIVMPPG